MPITDTLAFLAEIAETSIPIKEDPIIARFFFSLLTTAISKEYVSYISYKKLFFKLIYPFRCFCNHHKCGDKAHF
jgi:hypothetical protein